jgi:hypothetical protein
LPPCHQNIIAGSAIDAIDARITTAAANDDVVTCPCADDIATEPARKYVIFAAASDQIITGAAFDCVAIAIIATDFMMRKIRFLVREAIAIHTAVVTIVVIVMPFVTVVGFVVFAHDMPPCEHVDQIGMVRLARQP